MTTLSEDLERMAMTLRSITQHEVKVEAQSVYVNFDHAQAVVLDVVITDEGRRWVAEALAWDRTGGVSAEKELGDGPMVEDIVPAVVDEFLAVQDENSRRLEQMLSESQPED